MAVLFVDVNLTLREVAFLKHKMGQLKNDPSVPGEYRTIASAILGKAAEDIEWEKQKKLNGVPDSRVATE